MSKPRAAAIGGLAALTLGLAACGTGTLNGQQSPGQSVSPKAAVLAAMSQTKSISYKFAMEFDITGLGQAASALGGTGAGDTAGSESLSGAGAFSAPQEAIEMTMKVPGLSSLGAARGISEIVFVKTGKVYMSLSGTGASAKWYVLDISALTKLGGLSSLGQGPAGYLSGVSGAVVSASKIGTAQIDGVPTTEYAVTENLQLIMNKELGGGALSSIMNAFTGSAPGGVRAGVTKALQAALSAMPKYLTSDVWLDGAGHLRKMYVSLPMGQLMSSMFTALAKSLPAGVTGPSSSQLSSLEGAFSHLTEAVTMVVTDVGGSVDISAPPASQVSAGNPFTALEGGASGSASGSASFSS